ncbi:DNA internalization-related competence protein ComEC/Rec2, partial [bacterium]|nr:DNA internalization-related competence protein ComEC/Rec2 [bacterium]
MNKQFKVITAAIMFLLGILSFLYPVFCILGVAVIVILTFLSIKKKLFSFRYIAVIVVLFLGGILNTSFHLNYDDDLTPYTDNSNVTLEAKVLTIPTNSFANRTKFFAQVNKIKFDNINEDDIEAKCYVTINDAQDKINNIKIGDRISLTGRLKAPENAKNPAQFDYAKYLQLKNTFSLMYVGEDWQIISHAADFKGKFISKLNDARVRILDIHRENIKSPMIEVLGGIIFGDDAVNPDDDTKDAFLKSGIFHILAASGMNVTLIFGIWFFFASRLRFNYRFSIISGIILITVYTCMTGFGPPIIRAFLMLTLILIGKLIDRKSSTISMLFIVGMLMLTYNPLWVLDIGFQLSFIVTFALILTSPLIVFNFKSKFLNNMLGACMIPVIAQIYAAPLQLFYFNTFTMYSVLANIAIIPVLSIVSFIGFISSFIALIPVLAHKICYIADLALNPLLSYIVQTANLFASLPNAIVYLKKPFPLQIFLYFAIIIFVTCALINKLEKKKTIIITLILTVMFAFSFVHLSEKTADVTFFSVGNADAMMIKSPQNKYFLIDTGKGGYLSGASQAKNIIIKYFRENGIKDIEGLILSHFDSDHAGGTVDILDNLKVKKIYISNSYENTQLSESIIKAIKETNTNFEIINNQKEIYSEKDFKIDVIKPQGSDIKDENEKSIVALLTLKNDKVLFMGDGSVNTFKAL